MKRAILVIFLIIFILIGGAALYYLLFRDKFTQFPGAHEALPNNASLVYKGNNFRDNLTDLQNSAIWKGLANHNSVAGFSKTMKNIDSLIMNNERARDILALQNSILSLHNTAIDKLDPLFLIQTENSDAAKYFQELLAEYYPSLKFKNRNFGDQTIVEVTNSTPGGKNFAFTGLKGILVISLNPGLVEDAIRTFREKNKGGLHDLVSRSGPEEKIFINFPELPSFLGTFLNANSRRKLKGIARFFPPAQYDWTIKDDILSFYGNAPHPDSIKYNLELFKGQKPGKVLAPEVIPLRTAMLFSFSISDREMYLENVKKKYKNEGDWLKYRHLEDSIAHHLNINLREDFLPLLGMEVSLAVNEPVNKEFEKETFVVLHGTEGQDLQKIMLSLKQKAEANKNETIAPFDYRGFPVNKVSLPGIFPLVMGGLFKFIREPYFVTLNGFLLLSDDKSTLKRVIDDYLADQTLKASSNYVRLEENISSESNFLLYINPARALMIPLGYLDENAKDEYRENFQYIRNFSSLAFQVSNEKGSFYSQLTFQYNPKIISNTELLWKQKLEAPLAETPFVVKNHYTSAKEIFLGDTAGNIYLLDVSGNILWSEKLKSPLLGEVSQVDYYKNDKLQYAYATRNNLHLIDRTGKPVANFPIRLATPAVTGLGTFDFAGNKRYKYYIGCENGRVYGYYYNGKPIEGWSPERIDANLSLPVKYFILNGNTYLFGVSDNGTFYLWDSKGKYVIDPVKLNSRFKNPFQIEFGKDLASTYVVSSDTAGVTHFVYFNGKTSVKKLGNWGKDHYFNYYDLNRDGKKELIYAEKNTLAGFTPDSSVVFSITLQGEINGPPTFHFFEERVYVGYGTDLTRKVYLLDLDGMNYEGFPVHGRPPYVIEDFNKDGAREMILMDENDFLYMYRLK